MNTSILSGLALATLGLAGSGDALAATQNAYDYGPAAGNCQAALPSSTSQLRTRPLGITNEGAATVFVTCGPNGTDQTYGKVISRFFVRVGNSAATPRTITCTFVHGYVGGDAAVYVTRTAPVPTGGLQFLDIVPADLGANSTLRFPQVSCSLPPGAQLFYTGVEFTYEIGT